MVAPCSTAPPEVMKKDLMSGQPQSEGKYTFSRAVMVICLEVPIAYAGQGTKMSKAIRNDLPTEISSRGTEINKGLSCWESESLWYTG